MPIRTRNREAGIAHQFVMALLLTVFPQINAAHKATGRSPTSTRVLGEWTEADFRAEVDMFGRKFSRGYLLVNLVLSGFAAYRTQLFCYLKSCGREELDTMNLWGGMDSSS